MDSSMIDKLRALKEAHTEGLLDDDEFAEAKKMALGAAMGGGSKPAAAAGGDDAAAKKKNEAERKKKAEEKKKRLDALRAELQALKLSEVKKRATASGVSKQQLEEADDEDDIKGTVVGLIIEREEKGTVTKATGGPSRRSPRISANAAPNGANEETPQKKKGGTNTAGKGRKPLQDFVVGNTYPGTVASVSTFGAFIDVGCHVQGLCHISRLSDDYVAKVEDVVKVGESVSARVVSFDAKKKEMTLSMQSLAFALKEKASQEAKQERDKLEKKGEDRGNKPKSVVKEGRSDETAGSGSKRKRSAAAQERRNTKRLAKQGRTIG